jgi:hypothetical protein
LLLTLLFPLSPRRLRALLLRLPSGRLLWPTLLALGGRWLRLSHGPGLRLFRPGLLFLPQGLLLILGMPCLFFAPILLSEAWRHCSEKQQEHACLHPAQ